MDTHMTRQEMLAHFEEDEIEEPVTAEGYAYDQATGDWTKRVEYVARNKDEAINWMKFNQNWMKHLRIVKGETAE